MSFTLVVHIFFLELFADKTHTLPVAGSSTSLDLDSLVNFPSLPLLLSSRRSDLPLETKVLPWFGLLGPRPQPALLEFFFLVTTIQGL